MGMCSGNQEQSTWKSNHAEGKVVSSSLHNNYPHCKPVQRKIRAESPQDSKVQPKYLWF